MGKQIVINHMDEEIRVAVLEDSVVTEVHYERSKDKSVVGNIYKGKVLKVLPGMESAFVDIGLQKAAFLYVDDLRVSSTEMPEQEVENSEEEEDSEDNEQSNGKDKKAERPKINDLIKEGDEVVVQVAKGPIGTKGARVTCNLSIPGRNLVLTPHASSIGVSRQISDRNERNRLKQTINTLRPKDKGFIVRTVAENRSSEEFKKDIDYLVDIWNKAQDRKEKIKAPVVLYEDINLTFRTMRDQLSSEVEAIITDDVSEYNRLKEYLEKYLPKYTDVLKVFKRNQNIFDYYGVNAEIDRALGRKVWLKSGGHLVIDQSEALTAIDVNTGRFTGSSNHEDTIFQTNMEACEELVYQLKLRDVGGIIIIDFIDMEDPDNRVKVYNHLKEELKNDKARTKILQISEIGLVEMTRKRSRENLGRFLCIPCPYCNGTAKIKSPATTVYDIYRDLSRIMKTQNPPENALIGVHPDVYEYMEEEGKSTFKAMEKLIKGSITIRSTEKFHMEQYEIFSL